MKNRSRYAIVGGLLFVAFWFWYSTAANYDYRSLSGSYTYQTNGERCTLRLHADRTFEQEVIQSGETHRATGQWHRYGETHVSFSREFLELPGQQLNASGEAHGEFQKTIGLFTFLVLAPIPDGPKLHKKLFSR